MRKLTITAAILVAAMTGATAAAVAQSGTGMTSPGAPPPAASDSRLLSAPVGHRQPRASDVPPESGRNGIDRPDPEDAKLDRMLKNICRGC